jgi:hypothetical protein
MRETTINSFHELHTFRRSQWAGHYVYRGENSTTYTLRPKFGRRLADPYRADTGNVFPNPAHEQGLLTRFKRQAAPFLDHYPIDDWDWLAVAQHHGLATRLLDWTENILVAAYFACNGSRKRDAVIHVLNTRDISQANMDTSPFLLKNDVIFHPRHSTPRIAAQSGLFTVHADPAQQFESPDLERIIIPKGLLLELFATLRTYGFEKSKLFPGLDTVAEEVNGNYGCQ